MPYPDDSGWAVKYADPRSSVRMLVSLPYEMLRDVQALAKARGLSASELVRRCITRELKRKKT